MEQDYYRSRYVPYYRPLDGSAAPAPTGWMSWNTYFDRAGEAENLAEARLGAKHLKPYGLEIWSIESWQDNSPSQPVRQFHNLTLRPDPAQFPHGMEWLAQQIRKLGFIPGIWTVPFGTGDAAFYRQHRTWFLHHRDGRPMQNWCGEYVLDPSQPAVRRHMAQTHRTMAEWGYDFFKIDGVFGGSRPLQRAVLRAAGRARRLPRALRGPARAVHGGTPPRDRADAHAAGLCRALHRAGGRGALTPRESAGTWCHRITTRPGEATSSRPA